MNIFIYNLILGISVSFLYLSCSEEPIRYELEIGEIESFRLDADYLSYFRSYQSSPEMGLSNLYYGKQSGYSDIYSLIELNEISPSFFLETTWTSDSSGYNVLIDSIFFSIQVDTFTFSPRLFYFSGNGDTSIFSQDSSSYYTIDSNLEVSEVGGLPDTVNSFYQFSILSFFSISHSSRYPPFSAIQFLLKKTIKFNLLSNKSSLLASLLKST